MFWKSKDAADAALNATIVQAIDRSQAMITFDPTGTILEANKNFLDAMGYTREEIVGCHHKIFLTEAQANEESYKTFWPDLAAGKPAIGEMPRQTKSGRTIWISAFYTPVFGADGRVEKIIKFAADVTSRKQETAAMIDALSRLSTGDLTVRMEKQSDENHDAVRQTFNNMVRILEDMVSSIISEAVQLAATSRAIEESAADLADHAKSNKSVLQRSQIALDNMTSNITHNTQAAQRLEAQAESTVKKSADGEAIVANTADAIHRLEHVAKEVSKTTDVIESFAFQTNLLSLNAAVEAARAGEAGKGFAVVASEVQNLATRSGEASKEIAELTRQSETEVASGMGYVTQAGAALSDIAASVEEVMKEISSISNVTKSQIDQVDSVQCAMKDLSDAIGLITKVSDSGALHAEEFLVGVERIDQMVAQFTITKSRQNVPRDLSIAS